MYQNFVTPPYSYQNTQNRCYQSYQKIDSNSIDSTCLQFRFNLDSIQIQFGFNLDSFRIQFGYNSDSIQIQFGFNSNSIQIQIQFKFNSNSIQFKFNSNSIVWISFCTGLWLKLWKYTKTGGGGVNFAPDSEGERGGCVCTQNWRVLFILHSWKSGILHAQ